MTYNCKNSQKIAFLPPPRKQQINDLRRNGVKSNVYRQLLQIFDSYKPLIYKRPATNEKLPPCCLTH